MHDESYWKEGVKETVYDMDMVVAKENNGEQSKAAETGPNAVNATSNAGNKIELGQVT